MREPEWWTQYTDILPDWFETYLGLESAAVAIRSFEAQFWPGLLQTGDYARAVTRLGHKSAPQGEVEQLTSAVYLDQRADVEHYLEVADQLSGEALTPADTISFIEQAACETRPERKSDDHRRDGTARKEHRAAAVRHQQGAPCPDL